MSNKYSIKNWCVYVCHNRKNILYVGSGKIGRETHCNSGVSHVYNLNRDHFVYGNLETIIYKTFETKGESLEYEKTLIKSILPKYNQVFKTKEQLLNYSWQDKVNIDKNSLDMINSILYNQNSILKGK